MQKTIRHATTLRLDDELKERVQALAKAQGVTAHSLMIRSIESEVSTLEARQAFLQDAENAWQEYELTGLHLTADEMTDWLDATVRGENRDFPECHQ